MPDNLEEKRQTDPLALRDVSLSGEDMGAGYSAPTDYETVKGQMEEMRRIAAKSHDGETYPADQELYNQVANRLSTEDLVPIGVSDDPADWEAAGMTMPGQDDSALVRGLKGGIEQVKGIGYGLGALTADYLLLDREKEQALGKFDEKMQMAELYRQDTPEFTQISGVEDAVDWAMYTIGNLAPTMGATLVSGGVGGLVVKAGGKAAVSKMIADQMAKGVSREAAAKYAGSQMAKRIIAGQTAGAAAGSIGLETGSIYGEVKDKDVALAHGVIAGSIDALPFMRIFKKFGIDKPLKNSMIKSLPADIAKQAAAEGLTEGVQTFIEQHAAYWVENNGESLLKNLGEADYNQIVNAMAAGALGGGVMGGIAEGVSRAKPKPQPKPKEVKEEKPGIEAKEQKEPAPVEEKAVELSGIEAAQPQYKAPAPSPKTQELAGKIEDRIRTFESDSYTDTINKPDEVVAELALEAINAGADPDAVNDVIDSDATDAAVVSRIEELKLEASDAGPKTKAVKGLGETTQQQSDQKPAEGVGTKPTQKRQERRQDLDRREAIDKMSKEERYAAIYRNELTGINNRRAFQEDSKTAKIVASIDVDSLKTVNDNLGHDAGDEMLKVVARELDNATGGQSYHISGDEFYVLGDNGTQIKQALEKAKQALAKTAVTSEKGQLAGLDFTYGLGGTKKKADTAMEASKADREVRGERVGRGQMPKGMSLTKDTAKAKKKIDALGEKAKQRKKAAEPEGMSADLIQDDLDYLSDKEKTEMHDAKQSLPTTGEEAAAAKARIKKRIEERKTKKAPSAKDIKEAGKETNVAPTEAQIEADNYKKGRVRIHGMEIAIENPQGSVRSGTDADGRKWENKLAHHYGDIKGTKAADGDNLDVFIGPNPKSKKVFVVDQIDQKTGEFDEHKVMIGFTTLQAAKKGYLDNYDKGWKIGPVTTMDVDSFKEWVKGDLTKPLKPTKPTKKPAPKKDLQDFGEKIGGSRKEEAALQKALDKEYTDQQIATLPLSKLWPKKEVDEIENNFVAAFVSAARQEIPAKPRKQYKVNRWVENVKMFRNLSQLLVRTFNDGTFDKDKLLTKLADNGRLTGFTNKVLLLEQIDREHWPRINDVQVYAEAYKYEDGKKVPSPSVYVRIDKKNKHFDGAKSVADVVDDVKAALEDKPEATRIKLEIRGYRNNIRIVKKGDPEKRALKTFTGDDALKEAQAYMRDNRAALEKEWEAIKERDNVKRSDVRSKVNRPRTGKDHRKGKDVTPEMFMDTFGFRGATFGNWVKQGKNAKERQGLLNQTYDGLMDLAALIDIPPKAISLNGELGIGFGSHGKGGRAAAHYDVGNVMINLTKTQGAGSLAHEWFHALDNYFSNKRGTPEPTKASALKSATADPAADLFITHKPEPLYKHKEYATSLSKADLERRRSQNPNTEFFNPEKWELDPSHPKGVRPEVEMVFAKLVEQLKTSGIAGRSLTIDKGKKGYWSSMLEMAARSFESYVITKMRNEGYDNQFLANVVPIEEFTRNPERYPYLLDSEMPPIEEAFDKLFDTIETRETDTGVALYSLPRFVPSSNQDFSGITLEETVIVEGTNRQVTIKQNAQRLFDRIAKRRDVVTKLLGCLNG